MELITCEELKAKLDRKDIFKLVFTLGEWHFKAMHIPGSIHIDSPEKIVGQLDKNDDIVVYCASESCPASVMAYHALKNNGFINVRRFAGGLEDWQNHSYPLVGEMVPRENIAYP
ncbi:MAG: rhodanese-like domain-containing protein [Promethearchaeota archaeon]|jgi:rhodanese-related sulfurtransferase